MIDLTTRSLAEEQMDSADLPESDYVALLADLAQVNALTMAARPTLAFLDRAARSTRRLKVLDVGFGHGDMLRRIARWAKRKRIAAELVGIDLNPRSEPIARAASDPAFSIDYLTGDYSSLAGHHWDAIISSLVTHHMDRPELIAFIEFMESQSRIGWFVNDLHRHRLAHAGFPLLARLMGWHRIVREDGTLSIARAYRPAEWVPILHAAGVSGAQVRRCFPFRLCVERLH